MDDVTKPVTPPKSRQRASAKATKNDAGKAAQSDIPAADGLLSPGAIDALADIAKRTNRLARLRAEQLKTDDGYRVIDPKTVVAAAQEFTQTGQVDPARLVHAHFQFWGDMAQLWQNTASRFLYNAPAKPVIAPEPQDKRFKSELWNDDYFCDYAKQFYLLASRYVRAAVESVNG